MTSSAIFFRLALHAEQPAVANVLLGLTEPRDVGRHDLHPSGTGRFDAGDILGLLRAGRVSHARLATLHASASELRTIVDATRNPRIRLAVASNSNATPGVLATLSTGQNRAVAARAEAALAERGLLELSPATARMMCAAEASAGDETAALLLATTGSAVEQVALAGAPDVSVRVQVALVQHHQSPLVLDTLGRRRNLSPDVDQALVDAGQVHYHRWTVFARGTPAQMRHAIRSGWLSETDLHRRPFLDAATLDVVFEHADLARDRSLVWDLLCRPQADRSWADRALAGEFGDVGRRRAWSNPHLRASDLEREVASAVADRSIRRMEILARNPGLPAPALRLLAEVALDSTESSLNRDNPWLRVLEPLAENAGAPPDLLCRVANRDIDLAVRVLRNPASTDPAVCGAVPSAHRYGSDRQVVRYLTSRFGLDRDAWLLGVSLLDEWTGTLSELADTTIALAALQCARRCRVRLHHAGGAGQ